MKLINLLICIIPTGAFFIIAFPATCSLLGDCVNPEVIVHEKYCMYYSEFDQEWRKSMDSIYVFHEGESNSCATKHHGDRVTAIHINIITAILFNMPVIVGLTLIPLWCKGVDRVI